MKILYSNVAELNAGWGAEVFVNDALQKQGHETQCIDYKKHRRDLARQFLKADDFEVFLLQRGDGFPLRVLDSVRRPRFWWASELVSRCRDQDRLFEWGGFDYIWVRGWACRETAVGRGWVEAERCGILQSGFDPLLHQPASEVARDIDVLFVGSLTPRRVRILERLSQKWNVRVEQAFGTAMVDLLHRSKIVLNIHAEDFLDVETRIYEVLGSGAFLLSEPLARENPFTPADIPIWNNEAELNDQIAYFLTHEAEREAIRLRAHQSAWNGHTWGCRARQITEKMTEVLGNTTSTGDALNQAALKREVWCETPFLLARQLKRSITQYQKIQ